MSHIFRLSWQVHYVSIYKLTLSDQAQVTVQLTVFPVSCKDFYLGGSEEKCSPGPELAVGSPDGVRTEMATGLSTLTIHLYAGGSDYS
jgi:hypothetical protein